MMEENSKHEALSTNNDKLKNFNCLEFEICDLFRISNFEFQISATKGCAL